jgi:hypothetical protein
MTNRFCIALPCSADWDRMPGDDRVRYCPQCKLNVYNFSALSPKEIERLVLQKEGRLCGRFYQRADGTMLAQNCPVAVRAMLRWTSHVAASVVAALVTIGPAFARPFPQQTPTTLTQIHPAKKSLSAVFVAPDGEGMPDVKVTLRQESGEKEFTAKTNDAGEISFSDLPKGTYTLTATAGGFHPFQLSGVKAPYAAQMHFQLDLGLMGEVVEVKQPDYQPDRIHRFFSNVKHLF